MRAAYDQVPSRRRRATGFLLALAVELLIILALFTLAPNITKPGPPAETKTFSLAPSPDDHEAVKATKQSNAKAKRDAGAAAVPRTVPIPRRPVVPPPPFTLPGVLPMDLASSDISKMPSHHDDRGAGAADSGAGKDSASVYGPGEGPGGIRLYNAEWYREPSDSQLSFYLPHDFPRPAWAEIYCKTVEGYHVDDCSQLGESPVGSGLARAMRQAAWQFLVRPPRVGGHVQVGAWVRIHIDFTTGGSVNYR